MPAVLNTNTASLYAAKNLEAAQNKMATSVERLSSGLRINRARDDAAGLGISQSLTSQINSSNQGVRNLNDAISMVQTAEGAISTATEIAQRILTLATQGSNGSMSSAQQTAIRDEMKQLLSAVNSIGNRTNFSGIGLLNSDARTSAATSAAPTAEKFSFQSGFSTSDKITLAGGAFANIGGAWGTAGSAVSGTTTDLLMSAGNYAEAQIGSKVYTKTSANAFVLIGTVQSVAGTTVTLTTAASAATSANTILVFSGQMTQGLSSTSGDLSLVEAIYNSTSNSAAANFQMIARASDSYITTLATQRSLLGAYQNQIEFTVSNITELSTNLSAARSSVQDTDYASETATLTKGQILQQAATAMLAQANQMPNVILSLLK
jgi:flagellin